jgi:hypothetical protein
MPSRPSDLIRGAIAAGGTAAGDWFYVEHAGGLYRISRAELLKALVRQGAIEVAGAGAQLQFYNDGVGAINGLGTSSGFFDLRSVGAFGFYTGVGPTRVARMEQHGGFYVGQSGHGHTGLMPGDATQAGHVAFFRPDSGRVGYVGHTPNALTVVSDGGYPIILLPSGGGVGVGGSPVRAFEVHGGINGNHGFRVANGSTGGSAGVELLADLSSVPNAFVSIGLVRNGGSPYANFYSGIAITTTYYDTPGKHQFNIAGAGQVAIVDGRFFPVTDNDVGNGDGGHRWTQIFSVTGSINTSQRSEKASIVYLSREALTDLRAATLLRVGARLCDLTTSFQWKSSIIEKGQAAYDALPVEERANTTPEIEGAKLARFHTGWIHDDAVAAFVAEGLDPYREGAICLDPKVIRKTRMVETTIQETEEVPDPEFDVVVEEGKARRVPRTGTIPRPVFRDVLLFAEDGITPIMVPVSGATSLVDGQGNPVPQMRQATHSEPVMVAGPPREEAYDEEVEGEHVESLRVDYLQTLCLAALKAGVTISPEE